MKIRAIIFDFNGTLFHTISQLAPGAEELFTFCRENNIRMAAITEGVYDQNIIHHLGLDTAMEKIEIVQENGKTPDAFRKMIEELGLDISEVIAIGDLRGKEIRCMNMIGGTTIWLHNGHPGSPALNPDENPDFAVTNLKEAQSVLQDLLNQE
jgi:FMN phosphatase YigB (HAD superfamily)